MAERVTCPKCQARLRFEGTWPQGAYTCPRCLASIPRPAAPTEVTAQPPGEPAIHVQPRPFEIRFHFGTGPSASPDQEAHGDLTATGRVLVLLAVLSALGVFGSFCVVDRAPWQAQEILLTRVLPGSLVLLFICGVLLALTQDHPFARQLGVGILRLFGAGVLVLLGLLALGILLALVCAAIMGMGR